MKTSGVNLALLCQNGRPDSECVDCIIASTDLANLIKQAKRGDRNAARGVLALASSFLTSDAFGPMPSELRRYLGMALASISVGGKAEKELHLSGKGGRPRDNHRKNLLLAHAMYKKMRIDGKTYETASLEICDEIVECIRKEKDEIPEWIRKDKDKMAEWIRKDKKVFGYGSTPKEKTIQGIYDKYLKEIETIYEEVQKTRASLKT